MERHDTVGTNTGELITRGYLPPDGYYLTKEEPHPTRDDLRLNWIEAQIKATREATTKKRAARRQASAAQSRARRKSA
jgi:hypothetical protein